jgi:cytochrome c553
MNRLTACAFVFTMAVGVALADDAGFQDRIWPLLESRCVKCHGVEKQKGDLRLDSREAALRGGETGPALVPGKPEESLLIKLVHHADKDRTMPPKEKLKEKEIALLETWIKAGAPWTPVKSKEPAAEIAAAKGEKLGDAWSDPRNPIVKIFHGERLDLWSLKQSTIAPPPAAAANPIDAFFPSQTPAAIDPRSLIRRLTFDITGLPPTPEEVQAFTENWAAISIENRASRIANLIGRLLDSPRYGEHWARMWLDVVRYSDSNGFDWDEFRPLAWRFRDYVIRSFNADKSFDRFTREQLAGDELVPGAPRDSAEQEALVATGYLRLGPWDNSAGGFGEQERVRQQMLNDLVETTGAAFLGLSMSCCRCHDHKTDPMSHADYYRMRAFFEPVKFRDDLPVDLAPEQERLNKEIAAYEKRLAQAREAREKVIAPTRERLRAERVARLSKEEQSLLQTPAKKQDKSAKKKIEGLEKKVTPPDEEVKKALSEEEQRKLAEADKHVQEAKAAPKPSLTFALLTTDAEEPAKPARVLFQGQLNDPREEVEPGVPSILDPNPAVMPAVLRPKSTGRRSALADWIASAENPLTARVIVNRVWQSYFGEGLVATPNDFGFAGAPPKNPALLDWLAREFVREGWSLKKLHRLILTSAEYQRERPQGPRRLSAEQLRDAMLAVSGRLQESNGGPPLWPSLPEEVLKANPAFLDDNKEKTKGWYPSPPEKLNVRSIFLVQKRTVPVPFMATFDLPDNATSCGRRITSTVAPQALTLLNNPFVVECSKSFANRVKNQAGEECNAQISRAFAMALQREPAAEELTTCRQFVEQHSLAEFCRALLNLNEFAYIR